MLELTVSQVLEIEAKSIKCIKRHNHLPLEETMWLARNRRDRVIRRYARWYLKTTEYICERLTDPPLLRFIKCNEPRF